MRILIIGAGVLGCNLAHDFYKAGKDVTLLARGAWGETIRENGLVIKNKFALRPSCDRIRVISELGRDALYDVIFVCLRYTQLPVIIETLKENQSERVVFIGNNMAAQSIAEALPDKQVMFGFLSAAGHREAKRVESVDLRKITVGDLKGSPSHETFLTELFSGMKYKMAYEPNMGDYLISHAAFVVPAAFACYYTDGDLRKIWNDRAFLYKIIDANAECYAAVEALGHELLPKGEEDFRSPKYRKMCYHFYRIMCATFLGKVCASDHAMNAAEEMNMLAEELEKMLQRSGLSAEHFLELKQYMEPYVRK